MRIRSLGAVFVLPLLAAVTPAAGAGPTPSGGVAEFTVLTAAGHSVAEVEQAVRDSGGTVVRSNGAVGLLTATAPAAAFPDRVSAGHGVFGVARADSIGKAPKNPVRKLSVESGAQAALDSEPSVSKPAPAATDPLDGELWGLKSVRADVASPVEPGDRRVKVGVIDTGIDATHPDIAPNFDAADSRSFAREELNDGTDAVSNRPTPAAFCRRTATAMATARTSPPRSRPPPTVSASPESLRT
ncbi:S8 family serine peptidase [Amycolatopsis pigmentata]